MNDCRQRFFNDLNPSADIASTIVVEVNGRDVVASRVRPGEWTLSVEGTGRIGRVRRRQEDRAVYFVGFTGLGPETIDWISDDVDRVLDRLVKPA